MGSRWLTAAPATSPRMRAMRAGPLLIFLAMGSIVSMAEMVMDESSCQEVEEEECGLCHTVYMQECNMKQVEEMRPAKVQVCRNTTQEVEQCTMVKVMKEVEEVRPICSVKAMDKAHQPCSMLEGDKEHCRRVINCKLGKKMMKKPSHEKKCEMIKKKCFDVVKLEKKMQEKKACSFHPKTVCHESKMKECRTVKKKMCNYLDSNEL